MAGCNFIDTYFRSGLYPAPLPSISGVEGAGVVAAVGAAVSEFQVGDRVVYSTRPPNGSYAEFTAVTASSAVHIPPGISFEDAAAVQTVGNTALALTTLVGCCCCCGPLPMHTSHCAGGPSRRPHLHCSEALPLSFQPAGLQGAARGPRAGACSSGRHGPVPGAAGAPLWRARGRHGLFGEKGAGEDCNGGTNTCAMMNDEYPAATPHEEFDADMLL